MGDELTNPIPPTPEPSEPPQPPLAQPPKRRLNKNIISIFLIAIVFCSLLATLGYFYLDLNKKYNDLQLAHTQLQDSYDQLDTQYGTLTSQYNYLNGRYALLNSNYNALSYDYNALSNDHDALSNAFNDPLLSEVTPTTDELEQWLASDETDTILYTSPNFICGDFSVMLSQHAKLRNWDMGIVAIRGYNTYTFASYSHALNIIYTHEGLVYVEPQTDDVWWYSGHQEIYEDHSWEMGNGDWITVTDYLEVVWA